MEKSGEDFSREISGNNQSIYAFWQAMRIDRNTAYRPCNDPDSIPSKKIMDRIYEVFNWLPGIYLINDRLNTFSTPHLGSLNLLNSFSVGAIHLSHNQGKADTHELIPEQIWFKDCLAEWNQNYFLTYVSLIVFQG